MLDNSRVRLWNLWRKIIANSQRKRLPGKRTLCSDPNTKGTTILDLPEDVIVNILLRLPVKSLCRVQCVFKTAFDIARSPGFATLHTLGLLDSAIDSDIFKLIILTKSSNQKYDSIMTLQSVEYNSGKKKFTRTRQSDLVSKICFGNNIIYYVGLNFVYCNLLCFSWGYQGYGVPWLLVNPLRGEILTLPAGDDIERSSSYLCGMGFDHITSTYKIVYINELYNGNNSNNQLVARVLVLGTSSWRNIHLVSRRDASVVHLGTTVYTLGYMHGLIRENEGRSYIISFDFSKEELKEIPCPSKVSGFSDSDKLRLKLLNLKGSLAIVNCFLDRSDCIEVWVLKSYENKEWELRHRIEKDELKLNVHHHYLAVVSAETCVAWEHGICFVSRRKTCYFLDLRQPSMTIVELPTDLPLRVFGYTETLISLKNYGSVIKATESKKGEWHIDRSMIKEPDI